MLILFILNNILAWLVFRQVQKLFKWIIKRKGYKWFYWNIRLRLPSWKFARWLKFLVHGRYCSKCGTTKYLDVHHLNHDHPYWEWLFLWDLDILCRSHHNEEHPDYVQSSWQKKGKRSTRYGVRV